MKKFLPILAAVLAVVGPAAGAVEQPFGRSPAPVPGTIRMADYDTGGSGVGYSVGSVNGSANNHRPDGVDLENCSEGGSDLGWSNSGQWFRYTVNVSSPGAYALAIRIAGDSGTFHLQNSSGANLTGDIPAPSTGGWQTWSTVYATAILPAGPQVLTLYQDAGGYNMESITFTPLAVHPGSPTGLAVVPGNGQNTLTWTARSRASIDGAVSYSVYRRVVSPRQHSPLWRGVGEEVIARDVTTPLLTDTGVINGVSYAYVVKAVNAVGASRPSKEAGATPMSSIPDFGPNVLIFNPRMPAATIQSLTDDVFGRQQSNEFGPNRYAILFQPGVYNTTVRVGFYTQVMGLGQSPDDVLIKGAVQSDAAWFGGNATLNFWREAENMAVVPTHGTDMWAVSQACPFRRMHVKGNLVLCDSSWSSGGYLADCLIDGQVKSGTQQQWLSRNAHWRSWVGGAWNMVFVGVDNPPPGAFPKHPYTVVARTPVSREKPFLMIDRSGSYHVVVPALCTNSQGTTWSAGSLSTSRARILPISKFYIAHPGRDTATTMNAALSRGLNLLLTPGIYTLGGTIHVARPDTVVLGLGLATLRAANGWPAMKIADVDGVVVAGILFEAGPVSSPFLLQVGPPGSSRDHSTNPTSLHDLFFRVGGAGPGQAAESLEINSNDVIGDDFWLWRADHGNGVGWTANVAPEGLVVNGSRDTIYGLAVEHYQKYQTVWNGNHGRLYFYQSEAPYDVPSQDGWLDGAVNGFASYKVANTVTSHQAWGLGVYSAFWNRGITLASAVEAPNAPGVRFTDMVTMSLGGAGITHIINASGGAAVSGKGPARLKTY